MSKLPLISILLLCLACSRPRETSRGFYFWKQRYQPDSTSLHAINTLATQKLYVKMFDVTRDPATGTPIPVAKLDQRSPFPPNIQLIPTVFIVKRYLATSGSRRPRTKGLFPAATALQA